MLFILPDCLHTLSSEKSVQMEASQFCWICAHWKHAYKHTQCRVHIVRPCCNVAQEADFDDIPANHSDLVLQISVLPCSVATSVRSFSTQSVPYEAMSGTLTAVEAVLTLSVFSSRPCFPSFNLIP